MASDNPNRVSFGDMDLRCCCFLLEHLGGTKMKRLTLDPAEGVRYSRFCGDNQFPEGFKISLTKIKTKEDSKDGNASTKKHHNPVWDGGDAREDLSGDFR